MWRDDLRIAGSGADAQVVAQCGCRGLGITRGAPGKIYACSEHVHREICRCAGGGVGRGGVVVIEAEEIEAVLVTRE